MRHLRHLAFFLLVLLTAARAAAAEPGVGSLKGTVLDGDGLAVPAALLTLTSSVLIEGARQTESDANGEFLFAQLPPGSYEVHATKAGFSPVTLRQIAVQGGRVTAVTVQLRDAGAEVAIVASSRGTVLSKEFLDRIPTGRSYHEVISSVPGAVAAPGLGGPWGRPDGNPAGNDRYAPVEESTFRQVVDTPLSTFSVDVDTASYANVRRFLAEGAAPPVDAVRVEELLNYFEYAYPPPTNGDPFAAHAEVTAAPWAEGHRLVRIGIRAADLPRASSPPRNLVFLIDVSGSMSPTDRLPLVQQALLLLVRELGPADRVAIVAYAGRESVVLPPTPGNAEGVLRAAIEGLGAGGATAGAAGIRTAYALARENFQAGAINRVILATDGDFNVGVSSDAELVRLIERERESGVFLTVLGVGRGNLQDAKMELLADRGNGNYAYLDRLTEAMKVLSEQVESTLVPVAKDVKIQVEFNPAQVASYRLLGYENRALADRDFADDRKDAGEIGAGSRVTVLYEVVPAASPVVPEVAALRYQGPRPPTPAAASGELLTVHIRYKAPEGKVSRALSLSVRDEGRAFGEASADTRFAAAVAGFGMLLRASAHGGDLGWDWVRETARGALGPDEAGYRAEFLGLVESARRLVP